jgi:hypothetical protein
VEITRVESTTSEQPNRALLAYAMTMQSHGNNASMAYDLIRNVPNKFVAIQMICRSYGFYGDLYESLTNVPEFVSTSGQADFIYNIMFGYSRGNGNVPEPWKAFDSSYPFILNWHLNYIDENS